MNRVPDIKRLLDDVLAEGSDCDFRAALLDETLRMARRRRLYRGVRRATATLALVAACILLVNHYYLPRHEFEVRLSGKAYQLVRTQTLPGASIVSTRPLGSEQWVASVSFGAVSVTTTQGWRAVDDEELLALVAPRPAILIRLGANREKLIFVNPSDEEDIRLN
jgi:hypothetical protein